MTKAQNRKQVKLQYRQLADPTGGFSGKTLQAALIEAMSASLEGGRLSDNILARHYNDDSGYGTLVLNNFDPEESFFFGELVRFEKGAQLPLLEVGSDLQRYNLSQATAPAGHEPLRGVLYFMAIDNHVILLEAEVSGARAETYMSWLLGPLCRVVRENCNVILDAELSAEAGSGGLDSIDQVVIRPKPVAMPEKHEGDLVESEAAVGSARKDVSRGSTLEVLRAAGMSETDIQKMVEASTSIDVTLQIRFKEAGRRKALPGIDARRLLRNIPDDEMTLTGKGGRQKNGKIVKLTYPAFVAVSGSILATSDVRRALHEAYKYFMSNGLIDG